MLLPLLRYAFAWPELDRAGLAGQLPPTDILQHAKQYEVLIDVPGVDPTHIKLELYDSCLVISGTPKVCVHTEDAWKACKGCAVAGCIYASESSSDVYP